MQPFRRGAGQEFFDDDREVISGVLNRKITQMTLQSGQEYQSAASTVPERTRTVENACEGPYPTMHIKLLDGVSILSGIDVAGLEVDAVR